MSRGGNVVGATVLTGKPHSAMLALDEYSGNLTRPPYMKGANYRISGDLTNTDNVMNNTFWIGVQPALSKEMLEFAANKIEGCLSVNG